MVIALIYKKGALRAEIGLPILITGIFLLCMSFFPSIKEISMSPVLSRGIPSFLIVFGVILIRQFQNGFLESLGEASYSIYLVQTISIPVFYKLVSRLSLPINTDFLSIICLIFTAITGLLIYKLIEKPLISFLRRNLRAYVT